MVGTRMGGLVVAEEIKKEVILEVDALRARGTTPCLATVLVGDDPASAVYVRNKHKACAQCGIQTKDYQIPTDTAQGQLEGIIEDINNNDKIHGVLVQMPLPEHVDTNNIISKISPKKDVDGLTPYNAGLLVAGRARLVACTPIGIIRMLNYYNIDIEGRHAVIINRSVLVGKPLYHLLLQNNATVTTCHSRTKDIKKICSMADIIITGAGNPDRFVLTRDMIKDDAVVIDVAINRINGKLTGDADYDDIIQKASFVTPVPGGVGPMTVAMLLRNTLMAAKYA
ncbi:MAG: bifunctional 5,10-methylenetetrahydrofolate dehydrogenase/5,10-methenyltetrahydrofolate cyclohydrolase [Cenarchaeum sp. SB0678_bin_8]|nr:bifunctional 5,10-methylenetetrahydrofolate dehydrogenase/5,10-methenyltetrahydrofolate cyclohydrolase [Cenarchaeum sp. SB0666_bin_15]MYD59071.1 bifunctional 5,10-methylenetetrahydrofolate dehydrogenase/5,10-methenyltetrahydrofolate cyclohydrolase [Cenarchaeum sp. SB0678_bin_8]MYJ28192.1 bifunctional 5,10-methylenetetrahydrofolate dehydrogenase/5,10-methenyltetrahydrofolate cyclohydrolase [Cenarchaeum sp. SB0672_bin_9]